MAEEKQSRKQKTVDRGDPHDLGVPMLPSEGKERQGPEDALGAGPKRGDYRNRVNDAEHYVPEVIPAEEREKDEDGNITGPRTRMVHQNPRAEEIGDEAGLKGGVETDPAHPRNWR